MFSTICGSVVEENEKTPGDRNFVFGTVWPILRLREVEMSLRDVCHKTTSFTTCCLSLVSSVSVEIVIESVML